MGFRLGNTAVLEFAPGTLLDGATVRVSLDIHLDDFVGLQASANRIDGSDGMSPEMVAAMKESFSAFASIALRSWDIESEDGEPIPASVDGFMALPYAVQLAIFVAWSRAVSSPSPNSPAASANGDTSGAASELTAVA